MRGTVAVEGRGVGIRAIADRLDSTAVPPGQLMGFEPEVGNGRAVVAVGNPDTADNVVTFVPGSTVVGHTARDGSLDADALVFAGSPGVGVDHVDELRRPPQSVYSTTSAADDISIANIRPTPPDNDPIGEALSRGLDAHGRDPSSPEFGGTVFHSDPRGGHSDYWSRIGGVPNPALVSFGRIVVGLEPVR